MTSLRAILRRCEWALVHADEPPQRTAAAFAVGVALSFSPLLGFQILLAALFAWAFKLNRLVLFVGLCTNLPWLMAPYYAATTGAAAWVMGVSAPGELAARFAAAFGHSVFSRAFWTEIVRVLRPLFWPFVAGTSVAAALIAAAAYRAAITLAVARRAHLGRE